MSRGDPRTRRTNCSPKSGTPQGLGCGSICMPLADRCRTSDAAPDWMLGASRTRMTRCGHADANGAYGGRRRAGPGGAVLGCGSGLGDDGRLTWRRDRRPSRRLKSTGCSTWARSPPMSARVMCRGGCWPTRKATSSAYSPPADRAAISVWEVRDGIVHDRPAPELAWVFHE
jgi:hypothetical protein